MKRTTARYSPNPTTAADFAPRTLKEVADLLHTSRENVWRTERRAIDKLHAAIAQDREFQQLARDAGMKVGAA